MIYDGIHWNNKSQPSSSEFHEYSSESADTYMQSNRQNEYVYQQQSQTKCSKNEIDHLLIRIVHNLGQDR